VASPPATRGSVPASRSSAFGWVKREDHKKRIYREARELAATGRHNGWFHVAGELSLRLPLAMELLGEEPIRSELDRLCDAARPAWLERRRAEEARQREK
jgi:hypothetical protein